VATTRGKIDGYAVIDDEQGLHQPITFATRLSPRGMVERVEIMVYREPRGDEVRDVRFRQQFQGKTSQDPLRLNRDIDAVSGATVSSASLAVGVRRATILVEELALGLSTLASAPAAAPTGERDALATPPRAARPAPVNR
jgi:Na+-translocating ferredoxin:NAD+ oxidoreductase RnfG subunit